MDLKLGKFHEKSIAVQQNERKIKSLHLDGSRIQDNVENIRRETRSKGSSS